MRLVQVGLTMLVLLGGVAAPQVPTEARAAGAAGTVASKHTGALDDQAVDSAEARPEPFLSKPYDPGLDINEENARPPPAYRRFDVRAFFDHSAAGSAITLFTGARPISTGSERNDGGRSWYRGHSGLDIGTGKDELSVLAAHSGWITQAGVEKPWWCAVLGAEVRDVVVAIAHDADGDTQPDYWTEYRHLASIGPRLRDSRGDPVAGGSWQPGDKVNRGDVIAIADNSGCATGPHLHFEVKKVASGEGVANTAATTGAVRAVDPYGFWDTGPEPRGEGSGEWLWVSPPAPAGFPGVVAQTDDRDSAFHKFMPKSGRGRWHWVPGSSELSSVGEGFWWSAAVAPGASGGGPYANWAVWALSVPAGEARRYAVEIHVPRVPPSGPPKTAAAAYELRYLDGTGHVQTVEPDPVDQAMSDGWVRLVSGGNRSGSEIQPLMSSTVLVMLSDAARAPAEAGRAVAFDAVRMVDLGPAPNGKPRAGLGDLAIVLDDSTSMEERNKIDAIREQLLVLLDELERRNVAFRWTLVPFIDGVLQSKTVVTADSDAVAAWLRALSPSQDEGANSDCAEASLAAVRAAARGARDGPIWLITDDVPRGGGTELPATLIQLLLRRRKLHTIAYPPTCSDAAAARRMYPVYHLASRLSGGYFFSIPPSQTADALRILLADAQTRADLAWFVGSPGRTSPAHSFTVDPSVGRANILLTAPGGEMTLTLRDPSGADVLPGQGGSTTIQVAGSSFVQLDAPRPGEWGVRVEGTGEYDVAVSADTDVVMKRLAPPYAVRGVPFVLTARLNGDAEADQWFLDEVRGDRRISVDIVDDGSGTDLQAQDRVYSGEVSLDSIGDYRLGVHGQTASGADFERIDSWVLRVQGLSATPPENSLANPGEVVQYVFGVANRGDESMTIEATVESSSSWTVEPEELSLELGPGEIRDVEVRLHIPESAPGAALDLLTVAVARTHQESGLAEEVAWATVETLLSLADVPPGAVVPVTTPTLTAVVTSSSAVPASGTNTNWIGILALSAGLLAVGVTAWVLSRPGRDGLGTSPPPRPTALYGWLRPSGKRPRRVPIDRVPFIIGRGAEVHLNLRDRKVSRMHARLILTGKGITIEDLGSANGTYVNGMRVRSRRLRAGNEIRIGGTRLRYEK